MNLVTPQRQRTQSALPPHHSFPKPEIIQRGKPWVASTSPSTLPQQQSMSKDAQLACAESLTGKRSPSFFPPKRSESRNRRWVSVRCIPFLSGRRCNAGVYVEKEKTKVQQRAMIQSECADDLGRAARPVHCSKETRQKARGRREMVSCGEHSGTVWWGSWYTSRARPRSIPAACPVFRPCGNLDTVRRPSCMLTSAAGSPCSTG